MDSLLKGGTFGYKVTNCETLSDRTGGVESKSEESPVKWIHGDLRNFIDNEESFRESQHYKIVRKITNGRYGEVWEGLAKDTTGALFEVAVKKVSNDGKYHYQHAQREIKVLSSIVHPNIVMLHKKIEEPEYVVLLLELCRTDLYIMQQNDVKFDLEEVRSISLMTLKGLKAIHDAGLMHRDMKPSNLLLSKDGVIKVCDFGLARADTEKDAPFTLQISTKWYKALEVLLGEKKYNRKIDIWALGAIVAELLSGKVLFNGSCDIHILSEIFQVMGSEHYQDPEWVERLTYPQYGYFNWSEQKPKDLSEVCGTTDSLMHDFVKKMLTFSVAVRPSVNDCLGHPWLKSASSACPSLQEKAGKTYDTSRCY